VFKNLLSRLRAAIFPEPPAPVEIKPQAISTWNLTCQSRFLS